MSPDAILRLSSRLRGVLLAATMAACGAAAAQADAATLAGSALSIGTKRVPLPRAEWTLLSDKTLDLRLPRGDGTTTLESVVAGAGDDRTLRYLAVVRTNRSSSAEGGFGLAGACHRDDLHAVRIVSRPGSMVAFCTFVGHVLHAAPADGDPAWTAALENARRSGKSVPEAWLVVGMRVADGDDLLDVRYYFNPDAIGLSAEAPGAPSPPAGPRWFGRAGTALDGLFGGAEPPHDPRWLASRWSVEGVAADPRRAQVVQGLTAWADGVRRAVYGGFKGAQVEAFAPPPAWSAAAPGADSPPAVALPGEVALWKTLSWRAVGSSLDAAVSYALTGSLGVAGSITVIGGFVNAGVYYLHEKSWEAFGSAPGPGDLLTELPAAGIER